jgi:hypothetical protein
MSVHQELNRTGSTEEQRDDTGRPNNPVPAPILKGRFAQRVDLFNVGASGVKQLGGVSLELEQAFSTHGFDRGSYRCRWIRQDIIREGKTDWALTGAPGLVHFVADKEKNAPFIYQGNEAILHQFQALLSLHRKFRRQCLLLSIDIFIRNTMITFRGYL